MLHTIENIALNHFLNVDELQAFIKKSAKIREYYLNDNNTISSYDVDEFVNEARKAGVRREIPKI